VNYTKYYEKEYAKLVGRRIVSVRALTAEETGEFGWEHAREPGAAFFVDNGEWIIPMRDDEGNEPGALMFSGRVG